MAHTTGNCDTEWQTRKRKAHDDSQFLESLTANAIKRECAQGAAQNRAQQQQYSDFWYDAAIHCRNTFMMQTQ
eukprot:3205995-Rhodomonas_salina.1